MRAAILAAAAASVLTSSAYSQGPAPASAPFKKEFERGYRLKGQNRYAEAAAVFSGILAKDAANHAALTELGYLNADLKHYDSAARYLKSASDQDPENMRLRMDLAFALQSAKRPKDAADQFQYVAEHQGEFQAQAQKSLDAAVAKPESPRGEGYAALKRGDKAGAITAFRAAVAADPGDASSLKQLGYIDFQDGRFSEAAANFEAVRVLEPNDLVIALQLGYTYDRLDKKDSARAEYVSASASTDRKVRGAAQAALRGRSAPVPVTSL